MKRDQLCAIAHNLADSMASGIGLMIGIYEMDVFGEAAKSEGGILSVDFMSGRIVKGQASNLLAKAAMLYARALPDLCRKNGASADDFRELMARFAQYGMTQSVVLTITDSSGHRSQTEYIKDQAGGPLERRRILDSQGRVRRKPRKTIPLN